MYFFGMIKKSLWYLVLQTKNNHNIMVSIYLYQVKVLNYINENIHIRLKVFENHVILQAMLCVHLFLIWQQTRLYYYICTQYMLHWFIKENIFSDLSTIWENVDGYTDKYRCATSLYLISMLAHDYGYHHRLRCCCTKAWPRHFGWPQLHWQTVYIHMNGKCTINWLQRIW